MAEFLYQGLVDWFQDQVEQNKLIAGDKMPSLRKLAKEQGMSLNTVIHGYELLSQQGWIESRPKSGYFVCHKSQVRPANMVAADHPQRMTGQSFRDLETHSRFQKSLICQVPELLDQDILSVSLNNQKSHNSQGEASLRQALCHYLEQLGIQTKPEQLWVGSNPSQLLIQTIQALTQVGDKVLLLTPSDYRLSQVLLALGREPVCLSAGERGVDLEVVDRIIEEDQIKLLLFPSQFSFPAGQLISNMSLRRWHALIEKHQLTTIERDLNAHIPNRPQAVMSLKSLDQSGLVLYIGAFEGLHDALPSMAWLQIGHYEKNLAAILSIADVCPGEDSQLALIPLLSQTPVKAFAAISRAIWARAEKMKASLEQIKPGHLSVVVNKGGHSLWVRSNSPIAVSKWQEYMETNLNGLIPGYLLTTADDADYWFAFNLSLKQTQECLNWLEAVFVTPSSASDLDKKAPLGKAEEKASQVKSDVLKTEADDPVYNPMLDLINHDFG